MEMTDSAAEAILEAARKRFGQAEVFEESGESVSADFEDNRLKEITARQHHGIGLRVIHEGRIGFASTTDLRNPQRLVDMAEASAAYGDEALFEFAGPADAPGEAATWDPAVPEVSIQQMVDMGREGLELSLQTNEHYLYSCGIGRSTHEQRLLNTSGLDSALRATHMSGSVGDQLISEEGFLQVYDYKGWGQPFDSVLDLARIVLRKMEQASVIAPARLEAMPMIFTPRALGNLFGPVGVALSGKLVHKGSSVLRGRIGEQILDARLTITDDPTIPYAPCTAATDDEGTPARKQDFFTEGVLKTYMADLQTAGLLGIGPTGHAARSYGSRPGPSMGNVVVSAGETPLEQMIGGMGRGLIIEQTLGSGQSNTLAGEFSVNVELGFLVENGKVVGRVKDSMVAGNVYELLKKVEAVSAEREWRGSRRAPHIMVSGIKLAAQG
jgi:PmbA protein